MIPKAKMAPDGNDLLNVTKIMSCAIRSGFKLDHARPEFQRTHKGKDVSWNNNLVRNVKQAVSAARIL